MSRDGDRCYLCQRTLPAIQYEIEHIIPQCRGGTHDHNNLALACPPCNNTKSDRYISLTVANHTPCYWISA